MGLNKEQMLLLTLVGYVDAKIEDCSHWEPPKAERIAWEEMRSYLETLATKLYGSH